MSLDLMFITNSKEIALIAEEAGVDRIWIDLEKNGKEERQHGLDTVKSNHSLSDITKIKNILTKSKLMVRINPIFYGSKREIDESIERGADYIMLPMYKTKEDVEFFIETIDGRCKSILLLETIDAVNNLEDYINIPGIDEIHIGLNDLHLEMKKDFMFELLTDGTIENLSYILNRNNMKFGFGGIARIGYGKLPAERIITEHYRLNSSMAILSRSFCNINDANNPNLIKEDFILGVRRIREEENKIKENTREKFEANYVEIEKSIEGILGGK